MSTPLIERLATAVHDTTQPVMDEDRADLAEFLPLALAHAQVAGIVFDETRVLALAVHALAFVRRVRTAEHLDPLDPELASELRAERIVSARTLIDTYCAPREFLAGDTEVLLLALHFEAAAQLQTQSTPQA
ncbi:MULTISPECIES: hypothetical protein [unclassified Streptomyces]|uniref:hypothetical protein n=1 Tax=unclassified Streptomyces TaxID=2593676 RepID=UPI002258D766|nr:MULTISPECIES: hypothetical protein [unclassified Streptomyces]MCX4832204.1 hypothetical protein [Streptomyces sp. NBC_01016]